MVSPVNQLNSQTHYITDGSTVLWDFSFAGGYLDKTHVHAYYADDVQGTNRVNIPVTASMFVNNTRLRISPAVVAGKRLVIYRSTPVSSPLVDWTQATTFPRSALDTMAKQPIFSAAEVADAGFVSVPAALDILLGAQTSQAAAAASASAAATSSAAADNSKTAAAGSAAAAASSASSAASTYASLLAYTMETQYSVDGSTLWHTTYSSSDKYMRVRFGSTAAWGAAMRIGGIDGAAGSNGSDGASGASSALITLYQRSNTQPVVPTNSLTYTFATGALTAPNNGWSKTIPSGTLPVWTTSAQAISSGTSDTIGTAEWSTPVIMSQNGTDGQGINTATVYLFQSNSTGAVPAAPTADVTYTFLTGATSGVNNGWLRSMPDTGTYRYVTTAVASGTGSTDVIAPSEWSTPVLLSKDGVDGSAAQLVRLIVNAQAFTYDKSDALAPASQTITFTAQLVNMTGTAIFTCTRYDANGNSLGTVTLDGSGNTRTLTGAQFNNAAYATVTATYGGFTDTETVVKIKDGAVTPVMDLSNEAVTVPASSSGVVSSFTGASTTMTVWVGLTVDTSNWSFSISSSTGVSASLSGNTVTITAMTTAVKSGYVDITATRSGYTSITKRFSISKSEAGEAGLNAASLVANDFTRFISVPYTTNTLEVCLLIKNGSFAYYYSVGAGNAWNLAYSGADSKFALPSGITSWTELSFDVANQLTFVSGYFIPTLNVTLDTTGAINYQAHPIPEAGTAGVRIYAQVTRNDLSDAGWTYDIASGTLPSTVGIKDTYSFALLWNRASDGVLLKRQDIRMIAGIMPA